MGSHRVRLGDILEVVIDHRGRTPRKLGGDFVTSGIPVLSAKNVKEGRIVRDEDLRCVSPDMWDRWMPNKLRAGDVLLTSEAPLGEVAFLNSDADYCLGQRLFALRANRSLLEPRFLFYLLRSREAQIALRARESGTTAQGIRQAELVRIELDLPALDEQRAIAILLGALDDKIELNREMNRTLEAIAQALFKSWFVDFDPVVAKAAGRQPFGMTSDIAALFPDEFVDSELGLIPAGWGVAVLGDIAHNVRDGVSASQLGAHTAYIALDHMPKRSITLSEWGTTDGLLSGKFRFRRGDILFGKLRPYFHKVGVAPLDGVCSTDILVIQPNDTRWHGLVLGHLSSDEFVGYTDTGSIGTKMPRTDWPYMSRYMLALPTHTLGAAFTGLIEPTLEKMRDAIFESRTLSELRDALLPKLLSGEVSVREAEPLVEVAV